MGAFLLGVFGADVEAELEELEVELVGVHIRKSHHASITWNA